MAEISTMSLTLTPPTYRRWTAPEIARVRADFADLGPRVLARALGRSPAAVYNKAVMLGVNDRVGAFRKALRALYDVGLFDWQVTERLDCTVKTVRGHRHAMGLVANRKVRKKRKIGKLRKNREKFHVSTD